jgi:4-diphosphocytidyl-2-C-methyl-D-erythritol kinase
MNSAPRRSGETCQSPRERGRPPARVTLRAHAKINLELQITGVRPDGFHDLETVLQSIELHDTLHCEERAGAFALTCDAPDVPADARNLVWRAAATLWTWLGRGGEPAGAAIRLEKRVPVRAGLGGGSADAVAALFGLAKVWGVAVGPAELSMLAAEIGSDAAFFLTCGTALGLGRGERVVALPDLAEHWVVLVCPPFGVSSADAYGWYDADSGGGVAEPARPAADTSWTLLSGRTRNDLEGPVARRHPEIATTRTALLDLGARAAGMSGSGSAVFGLFETRAAADVAGAALTSAGGRVLVTRTLTREAAREGYVPFDGAIARSTSGGT